MSLTLLLALIAVFQSPSKDYKAVTFESFTRGGRISIRITPDSVFSDLDGIVTRAKVKSADWKALCNTLNKLNLNKLGDYQAPTSNRSMDAAWHSSIHVNADDKEYSTVTFDNRNAPNEVKSLMNCINNLEKAYFKKK